MQDYLVQGVTAATKLDNSLRIIKPNCNLAAEDLEIPHKQSRDISNRRYALELEI